ncbi:MAG: helix-turn-helix transcriptional regulator [Actinomycetota bacterium]
MRHVYHGSVNGGQLVLEARRRAGLTQRQLAGRSGLSQAAVARIESGETSTSFVRIVELVRACGFDLDVHVVPLDEDVFTLAEQNERLSPDQRLDALMSGLELYEAGHRARGESEDERRDSDG